LSRMRRAALIAVIVVPLVIGVVIARTLGAPRYAVQTNGSLTQGGNSLVKTCDSCAPAGPGEYAIWIAGAYCLTGLGVVAIGRIRRKTRSK
jgi:hypothetical protein